MTLDVKSTVELGTSTFRENFAANIVYSSSASLSCKFKFNAFLKIHIF